MIEMEKGEGEGGGGGRRAEMRGNNVSANRCVRGSVN